MKMSNYDYEKSSLGFALRLIALGFLANIIIRRRRKGVFYIYIYSNDRKYS